MLKITKKNMFIGACVHFRIYQEVGFIPAEEKKKSEILLIDGPVMG